MFIEKIEELKDRIMGKEKDRNKNLYTLQDAITICGMYVDSVINMGGMLQVGISRVEEDEAKEHLDFLARKRAANLKSCITSLNLVNGLCLSYGQEEIFPGIEAMDRTKVADVYVKGLVDEFFREREK